MCRQSKRFLQQLLRRSHLPQQLIADRQKSEIVRTVPVVLCTYTLGAIVGILQLVRLSKLLDGILDAPGPAKLMPAHVMRVRNR